MVSRPGVNRRRYVRKSKRQRFLVLLLLCLTLFLTGGSLFAYVQFNAMYHRYLTLAQAGTQHLRTAVTLLETLQMHPFEPQTLASAQQEFTDALSETEAIETGIAKFSGIAGLIPIYGPRLEAAIHLSALAVDVSQAGVEGCKLVGIVLAHFHSPLTTIKSSPLTIADLKLIDGYFQEASASLGGAISEATQLQPGDVTFDAHLPNLLANFQANIPMLRGLLAEANQLLPSLPALLGIDSPANYLIEIMDSTELRPAGGFIGNYGILTIKGGQTLPPHINDVDLLDKPFKYAGHTIPYPPAYSWFSHYLASQSWSLRDSNLDADFPTAARYGEQNYQIEGGNITMQGVIAITPALIQNALAITGPIHMPEYGETVTTQNLVSLIHFHQLGGSAAGEGSDNVLSPYGHSSLRKRFTELLAEHFLARVQQLPSDAMAKFLRLLVSSLRTKDVQAYFNAHSAENMLQLLHLDGAIQSPPGDHLFIVDANVAADKANAFIVNTVHDQVTIDEHGNAVHRTTINYAWTLPGYDYGSPLYQDYVRIYVPPGSTLSEQDGWQSRGTSTAFGSEVWAGYFTLIYGQTRTVTLEWTSYGVAMKDANSWHYQYLLQRQVGAQRTLQLQVSLPICAAITSRMGGLAPGDTHTATLAEAWNEDVDVGLTYAC